METVQDQIFTRIRRLGRGSVFTPKDFVDKASRNAVDQSLSRLLRAGDIQRVGRGLFYYPKINAKLGITIMPDLDEIAQALGRQTGSKVAPSGAVAANRLGLSTQVPAKPIYLTDGRSRDVNVGDVTLQLKHVSPKELPLGSKSAALVIQALKYLGKDAVDESVIAKLRRTIPLEERRELTKDAPYTTDWVASVLRSLAQESAGPEDG